MSKVHVFNAGPCLLPQEVYQQTIDALKDFAGTGVSLMSTSHRTEPWQAVMDQTRALWRELLDIPEDYEVLMLHGGASMGFLLVAMNFLEKKAAYLDTGVWAHKALAEAQGLGNAFAVASSADRNYSYIPKDFTVPADADYLHITTNNTIYGTEILKDPDCPVPLIADMSSDILSRPIDVRRYTMIYGGAQKNAGTSGLCFAIVKKEALGKVSRYLPSMLDLRKHMDAGSMFNTPPVVSIYVMNRTLAWTKEMGGVARMQELSRLKASALYAEIDRNPLFMGTACSEDRSLMNVCFVMAPGFEHLSERFLEFAAERGVVGIKGHRLVGGFRASIYNACTMEDVQALINVMRSFEAYVQNL